MYCVKSEYTIEETIKKSRFIAVVTPCTSQMQLMHQLANLQAQHPNANHIAFAYRIKTEHAMLVRCHDAGEPSGTAGKPILQHLEGKDLINVLIAVIRYFGGIKLGAGGLTRAYGGSAKKALEATEIIEYIDYSTLTLSIAYKQMQSLEYHLKKMDGEILKQDFSETITLLIRVPRQNLALLRDLFA